VPGLHLRRRSSASLRSASSSAHIRARSPPVRFGKHAG